MLLAIDIGNTEIVFAIFDNNKIIGNWRLSTSATSTVDEYAASLGFLFKTKDIELNSIKNVIISSVVPKVLFVIRLFCKEYFECTPMIVGEKNLKIGIDLCIENKEEIGADRIVNSVAVFNKYKEDSIVIDFGTATTFDIISSKGRYMGGIISPGVNLSLDALRHSATKLPGIGIQRPEKVIGVSTVKAMQSGIYWGYISLIEGLVNRIREEYNSPLKTIATGGLAYLFYDYSNLIECLDNDLTIYGLKCIFEKNKGKIL